MYRYQTIVLLAGLLAAIAGCRQPFPYFGSQKAPPADEGVELAAANETPADDPNGAGAPKIATIETSRGAIQLQLHNDRAPRTCQNFEKLATSGFYNGLTFHRVIPNFMVQTGCPRGDGTGDAGYKFADEFHPTLRHDGPGVLAMANSGPNTNGSQFYITHVATPHLDNKHTVFGHVLQGQDVVDSIRRGDTIKKVTISTKPPAG